MGEFGILNWSIVITYVLANLALGFALSKQVKTSQEFFLGAKRTPWWAIGISVIATYVSALSFLGAPAWSYDEGLSVIAIHLNYPLVVFFVITFFLPFFYNSGVASIYDYQEKRFGPKARTVVAGVFLISSALTSAAILYATSLVIQFMTGIDVVYAILIVTVIALIYTILGGITAVIWTDVIQSGILFVGAIIIFAALLGNLPGGVESALNELKDLGRLDAINTDFDLTEEATIWAGLVAMVLYHTTVYGANQMMVQRTLCAKSIGDAKKAYLLMGFAAFFIYFLFMVSGVLFYSYYDGREFENGNTIILRFASDYGFPGLIGILAAAVVAASMSSLDSALNSLSTISTVDFYKRFVRGSAPRGHFLKVSRVFTVIWAVLIVIPALGYSMTEGSILQILSSVGALFVGSQLAMFALGFFSPTTTENGLLAGVAGGFIAVALVAHFTEVAWPWYCLIGAAVTALVAIPASFLIDGQAKTSQVSPYTIQGQRALAATGAQAVKEGGWHTVPGRVDKVSYLLLVFLGLTLLFMVAFPHLV